MNKKIEEKIKQDKIIQEIMPFLQGTQAHLVGGYIRDIFLNKETFDRDIILIHPNILGLVKDIAKKINATFVELDKDWEIYRLVCADKKNYIDFAKAIDNNIEKDIKRRDITINAIAYNIEKNEIFDPANGLNDIKNKNIRSISEQNFIDDPLRLLRVFRFCATTGFNIEEKTFDLIKKHAKLIENPAKERIQVEILKLFEGENCVKALKQMNSTEMLEAIFPFIKDIKLIPPNAHHHLNLLEHSFETIQQINNNMIKLPEEAKNLLGQNYLGEIKKYAFLKLAGFMHDIGKPKTWTIDEETGRHRFIKHDSIGAELAPAYLKPLKFSKKQIAYIQTLIKHHIYPSNVNINNEKSVMKFLRKMDTNTTDIILLAIADRLSAKGPQITEEIINDNLSHLNTLLKRYLELLEEIKPLPKLLSGNEIMDILKIQPSPKLGQIIANLKEAQEDGEITTKEEAINFIKNYPL